jgi:hypothetical protein
MDAARQRRVRELARWLSVRARVVLLMRRALADAASCGDMANTTKKGGGRLHNQKGAGVGGRSTNVTIHPER